PSPSTTLFRSLQQADQQAFALLEKAVVLAGGFDQFAELALELVPLSPEQGDLVGDQGDGSAAAMRNPQLVHQLFMLNKKFWVSQQIAGDRFRADFFLCVRGDWLVGHKMPAPENVAQVNNGTKNNDGTLAARRGRR